MSGSTGATGPQGIQGVQGIQGFLGYGGFFGPQGIQGVQGPIGPAGQTGPQGPTGSKGQMGFRGLQGINGSTGVIGPYGLQGIQGIQGYTGQYGIQGVQGIQGQFEGPTGPDGITGSATPDIIQFDSSSITVSGNEITISTSYHKLSPSTGNSTDLKKINGGSIGDLLLLDSSNLSKLVTIVVNTSTGNILLNNDDISFPLVEGNSILFVYKEIYTGYRAWCEQTRTVITITLPPLTLGTNGITIEYIESSISTVPRFIQANIRGTGLEWFAVVNDTSKTEITNYATNGSSSYFTPSGESSPVIFNNIVTTLMTDMRDLFSYAEAFNQVISSWDTSSVNNMSGMFAGASAFNEAINYWDTSKVEFMFYMFYNASTFNKNISNWNVSLVSSPPPPGFRDGSALSTPNTPPAFR